MELMNAHGKINGYLQQKNSNKLKKSKYEIINDSTQSERTNEAVEQTLNGS